VSLVLVTGGAGFIGANLLRLLLESGAELRVVDDLSSGRREYLADLLPDLDASWIAISDLEGLQAAARGADAIVHLAARSGVGPSIADPAGDFEVNVAGTFNVLEAAHREDVRKLMLTSAGAVLAGASPPLDEGVLPAPQAPYGASKLCGEAMVRGFSEAYGIAGVVLRFSNVYGPRCLHKSSAVPEFIRRSLRGEPLVIHGDGEQTRDFIHVDDIARAIAAALKRSEPGLYQIGTGVETSVVELARLVAEATGGEVEIEHDPPRAGDARRNFFDASRARDELGWAPSIELRSGLASTCEWIRAAT
jgi:UDP-glucose 4-epimerase